MAHAGEDPPDQPASGPIRTLQPDRRSPGARETGGRSLSPGSAGVPGLPRQAPAVAAPGPDAGSASLPAWFTRLARHPLAAHPILLAGYLVTGLAVTWPRVTYLGGRLPGHPGRRRVRLGFLVGRPPGVPPVQPLVHPVPRRAGGRGSRLSHADATARPADDSRHAGLRAEPELQPALDPVPRPAVLRDVPGGPALAAHPARRDHGRGLLRPVHDPHLAQLVRGEPGAGGAVPADGAGGRGPAAPPAGPAAGRHPGRGHGRGHTHRPGIGGARDDRRGPGPRAVAGPAPRGWPGCGPPAWPR